MKTEITVAPSAGFCFGVQRAVDLAYKAAENSDGEKIYTIGKLIHNDGVIKSLEAAGIYASDAETVPEGSTVIIRAHGASPDVYTRLKEKGCTITDATCSFVTKIHETVKRESTEGRTIIIIGNPSHPEVKGFSAEACGNVIYFTSEEDMTASLNADTPVSVVAQTTVNKDKWNKSVIFIKSLCTSARIFDTICNATEKRQRETAFLAASQDAVIVIGDRSSANTENLAVICSEAKVKLLRIESLDELHQAFSANFFSECKKIGITAGASVPYTVIKEVVNIMSEELNNPQVEESFAEMLEKNFKTLHTGERVIGVVTNITANEVQVDCGTKHAGFIPFSEVTDDPAVKVPDILKIGDEIEVFVIKVNDAEGSVLLSKKKIDSLKAWDNIESAADTRIIVEGIVVEDNKGGVIVNSNGVQIFVPASQTGLPRDASMSELLKKKVKVRISEVNRARHRVRGSIRAAEAAEKHAEVANLWASIAVGNKYKGTVKSITSYGAFVDIGGVDGMVHITELSWSRIKHPSDVVTVGDEIEVYVIGFDPEKRKISLGYKDPSMNPWQTFLNEFEVGDVTDVRIVKLMRFGAFAEIIPGVDGLIHISQIADRRIAVPGDVVSEGEIVKAKIIEIDEEKKKISLSMRQANLSDTDAVAEEPSEPQA